MKDMCSGLSLKKLNPKCIIADSGFCYIIDVVGILGLELIGEKAGDLTCLLFENDLEVGPQNTSHDTIRATGGGAYSFYGGKLWFSASDNSDPRHNGKTYFLLISKSNRGLGLFSSVAELALLGKYERYNLAKTRFREVWPELVFPDCGRLIDRAKEFIELFHLVCPEAEYSLDRKYALSELFKLTYRLDGDVAECGTHRGASAFFLARSINQHDLKKKLFLFDSFMGLSPPCEIDGGSWKCSDLRANRLDVLDNLKRVGETPFVEILEGWIPSRFEEVSARSFCFVHLDVDLAHPTLDSLMFFYPRMVTGGMILIDDYGFDTCPGVSTIVDSFMEDKCEPIINLVSGGCFIVKQSADLPPNNSQG